MVNKGRDIIIRQLPLKLIAKTASTTGNMQGRIICMKIRIPEAPRFFAASSKLVSKEAKADFSIRSVYGIITTLYAISIMNTVPTSGWLNIIQCGRSKVIIIPNANMTGGTNHGI